MLVLAVGATGKTGRCLVEQLLDRGHHVRAVARSTSKLPSAVSSHPNLTVIEASILELSDAEMARHVAGCGAVVSCLGHVIDLKGMFGEPRKLCTETARRLCNAIETNRPGEPTKFILMNTVGVGNPELDEKRTLFERGLLSFLRLALPPHRDNETAAEHLQRNVGRQSAYVEWCSVRPDSLIDADLSSYEVVPSPTTGILTGRATTRANVARFMVELVEGGEAWSQWRFQMPVIMNEVAPNRG